MRGTRLGSWVSFDLPLQLKQTLGVYGASATGCVPCWSTHATASAMGECLLGASPQIKRGRDGDTARLQLCGLC